MITSLFLLATASPVAVAPAAQAIVEPNPKAMTQSEIRAHNAPLARSHPYFIRCVKAADTGSLVKRKASCRTNEQWKLAEEAGNREARDVADHMRSKATVTN